MNLQKGALGRPRIDEPRTDRGPIWFATPGRVPRIGPRYANKAVWITASGDQTFVQVSQTLIKTDTIFSATITANSNTISEFTVNILRFFIGYAPRLVIDEYSLFSYSA